MDSIESFYGDLTFNKKVMRQKLSKEIYKKFLETIERDMPLDESIAYELAQAMKEWAIEHGATHFTHWFQPRRSGTAEKHDSFIGYDDEGEIIERFSGKQLIQSEPDASSFPSGGIRSTFEARGYTAWDPVSPAFLMKAGSSMTLVIPSVFLSFNGEVLDLKTPMLRAYKSLNTSALRLFKHLGNRTIKRIKTYGGIEQEFFLVSKDLYDKRPDLRTCGRTLFGSAPAKGQEMEDHYFGTIKEKVLALMHELDEELYKRGIPSKTRHNEVAPSQFEIACLYEEERLAVDHNLQLMNIMKRIASRNGFKVLLKEKPYKGVNGSGKHYNWSIGDEANNNFLTPSKSPLKNISFLITIGAILLGLNKYGDLIRVAVANAGNDHRLGGFEAPPAIISVYLGNYLSSVLDEVEGIGKVTEKNMSRLNTEIMNLPKIAKDISDRNRTAPIAFTGDKFEFRVVGSSMNCAEISTAINTIVSYGFDEIYKRLKTMKGDVKKNAVKVLKDVVKETKRVRFEGNNYSKDWLLEAERRKLSNIKNTPKALKILTDKDVIKLFSDRKIYIKRELEALLDIKLNEYGKVLEIEFKTAVNITKTLILPAIIRGLGEMSSTYRLLKQNGMGNKALYNQIDRANKLLSKLNEKLIKLEDVILKAVSVKDEYAKSCFYSEEGLDALNNLRAIVDETETIIADDLWPLPKYQELLCQLQ